MRLKYSSIFPDGKVASNAKDVFWLSTFCIGTGLFHKVEALRVWRMIPVVETADCSKMVKVATLIKVVYPVYGRSHPFRFMVGRVCGIFGFRYMIMVCWVQTQNFRGCPEPGQGWHRDFDIRVRQEDWLLPWVPFVFLRVPFLKIWHLHHQCGQMA